MKKLFAFILVLGVVLFACQKETSFEGGNTPSEGLLQSDVSGDCLPKTVAGSYVAGSALDGNTEFISVDVDVTTAGSYTIFTDTVNGVFFRRTGNFAVTGTNTINLQGSGTPAAQGTFNFRIQYNGQECDVSIAFLPSGAGGPAVFTLAGAPTACTGATPNGSYATGLALTSANTATLSVNVTTIGTYSITTNTVNGMSFAGNGTFTSTGVQNVTINGTGTPTAGGSHTYTVTAGTSTCTFAVTVGSASAGTLGGGPGTCTPVTFNGTYSAGTAMAPTNTATVQVTVTTPGVYSITTNTVNGMSFTGSGNFAANGAAPVILTATGTPTAAGTFNYTVTYGTSTCTFDLVVTAVLSNDYFPRTTGSNWSYEYNDIDIDSLRVHVIAPTHSALGNVYNIFMQNDGTGVDSAGYYRKAGGDYYTFLDMGAFLGFASPLWVEYIFLKDNMPVGTNWKTASYSGSVSNPPVPMTIRMSQTIVDKDITLSIVTSTGTVSYSNVIVVEEKFEYLAAPPNTWADMSPLAGHFRSYYARGIGLIKLEYYDMSGALAEEQELRRKVVN